MKKLQQRQKNALERLQNQLQKGLKPDRVNNKTIDHQISLTETDKIKINKEIELLKTKVS